MAGEIYLSGLSNSGFDYKPLLDKYRELKSIPLQMMQNDLQKVQEQQKALSAISAALSAIMPSALDLTLSDTYQTKKVNIGDSSVVSASVSSDAINSNYYVEVLQLAKATRYRVGTSSTTITDVNATLSSGSLNIEYYKDGSLQNLTIDYTGKTLADLVNEINQTGDLQASIINIGTDTSPDYELIVSSVNTGVDNRINSITDTGSTFDNISQTVSAQNAQIRIDGILFESNTNSFNNVITGVSITAKTTGSTQLSVSDDYTAIKESIQSILTGYNQLKDTIKLATSKGQPLQGEASLNTIATGLFRLITSYLGKYGLLDADGTGEKTKGHLILREEAFNEFMNTAEAQNILQELGSALESYLSNYTDSLNLENQRYIEKAQKIQERMQYMQERIDEQIEAMRLRYAKLEIYLSEMQSLQLRIQNFTSSLTGNQNKSQ